MSFYLKKARVLFSRGLRLRCPVCGEGKLYRRWFKMNQHCPDCVFIYEREPGYYTSALAINVFLSELITLVVIIPLAASQSISFVTLLLIGGAIAFILPLLFYHHAKSLWMSIEHLFHPVSNERIFFPK
jgi:uncharacterized protein (DUF983 family)